jgi:hypothetical protein
VVARDSRDGTIRPDSVGRTGTDSVGTTGSDSDGSCAVAITRTCHAARTRHTAHIERALALAAHVPGVPDAARTRELARVLDVRRNALLGFGSGVVLAVLAYAYRVGHLAGPTADNRGSPALFLLLAFVLAVSVGLLVTAALTVRSAVRVARESDAEPGPE